MPSAMKAIAPGQHGRRESTPAASPGIDHRDDRQIELLGELEVAGVVGRHGHDRPGAVADQHVVGHPDRNRLAVDRIDRRTSR